MRRISFITVTSVLLFLIIMVAAPRAVATYGRAEIWVPDKEMPLGAYKVACQREVKPRFIAHLKEQDPFTDEKTVAKEIMVGMDEKKRTIFLYVPAADSETAIENAKKIAELTVGTFVELAESRGRDSLNRLRKNQEILKAEIESLHRRMLSLQGGEALFDPAKELQSLTARLNSFKEQLIEAELGNAELEAQLELFSKKAEQTKEAVSSEEVAFLRKTALELAMKIDQAAKSYGDKHPEMVRLREQLAKVEHDLGVAHKRFAKTGGLKLAAAIAGKKLECEAQIASIQARVRHLPRAIEMVKHRIAEMQSVTAHLKQIHAEIGALTKRLQTLFDRETALRAETTVARKPEIVVLEAVERIPERTPKYSVIGEVKNPGSYELLTERSVLAAIAAAGGFTEYANEKGVVVISNPERSAKSRRVDLNAILRGESPEDFRIQPGDIVWVPRKTVIR